MAAPHKCLLEAYWGLGTVPTAAHWGLGIVSIAAHWAWECPHGWHAFVLCLLYIARVGTPSIHTVTVGLQPPCRQESSSHGHLSPLQEEAQQQRSQAPQHPSLEARSPPQREALVRAPAGRTRDGDRVFSSVSDGLYKVPHSKPCVLAW